MKKVVIVLIMISLLLVGCKEEKEIKNKKKIEEITGGWEMFKDGYGLEISKEDKKVLDKALKDYKDKKLEPIALLGTQVVSGTNYMFLCKTNDTYEIVVVYKNLKDKVSLTSVKELDYTLYTGKDIDFEAEEVTGGWSINKNIETGKLDKEYKDIFSRIKYSKLELKPVYLLGTQLVAGNNYAFLALGKNSDKKAKFSFNIVTIYKDLEDNVELSSVSYLDLGTFNE